VTVVVRGVVFGSAVSEALAFGFNVDPARIEVSIPAGKRRGKTISVSNYSDHPMHLAIYLADVATAPDGTNEFPKVGTTEWSCAGWVQTVPAELDLKPGDTRDVRVSISAPPDARGGRYGMLFFETTPSYEQPGIGVNFRIGTLIDVTVSKTVQTQARLADVALVNAKELHVTLLNEGNALVRPTGRIKIFDARNAKIAQADFNPRQLGVLPKTLRMLTQDLERPLPPGAYRLKVEIDYGARSILVGELPVTVSP